MCPHLSKGGTQIFKFRGRGELKINLGWGKLNGGERFSKRKGGTKLFKSNLRDRKGQKLVLLKTN